MYLLSLLQGQDTSGCPGSSGIPTEWTQGTKSPSSPKTSYTARPMRVMMRMLAATYGESEISTPMYAIGEPSGPMLKGITYSVRPCIEPWKRLRRVAFISLGGTQLLVGPASFLLRLQIKVRSSTRATSFGSERA